MFKIVTISYHEWSIVKIPCCGASADFHRSIVYIEKKAFTHQLRANAEFFNVNTWNLEFVTILPHFKSCDRCFLFFAWLEGWLNSSSFPHLASSLFCVSPSLSVCIVCVCFRLMVSQRDLFRSRWPQPNENSRRCWFSHVTQAALFTYCLYLVYKFSSHACLAPVIFHCIFVYW